MEVLKCPACNATLDEKNFKCEYCGTRFRAKATKPEQEKVENKTVINSYVNNTEEAKTFPGCLIAIMFLVFWPGAIAMIIINQHRTRNR